MPRRSSSTLIIPRSGDESSWNIASTRFSHGSSARSARSIGPAGRPPRSWWARMVVAPAWFSESVACRPTELAFWAAARCHSRDRAECGRRTAWTRTPPRIVGVSRGSLSVQVLYRGLVAPDNLVARQVEGRGDLVAFLRTGCPPAERDRQHALLVEVRASSQL